VYVDASRKKNATSNFVLSNPTTVNLYDVGVNHSF
jgi:hypothetical protein